MKQFKTESRNFVSEALDVNREDVFGRDARVFKLQHEQRISLDEIRDRDWLL